MLPFYNLSDFPDRRSQGRNWLVTCPQCGKRHMYIDKATGKFLCFYSGCDFRGILEDFRTPSSPLAQLQVKSSHIPNSRQHTPVETNDCLTIADDYHALPSKTCANLIPLADCQPVVDYLREQHLPLATAEAAGCMATLRVIAGKPHHCICYVNRVNGDIVNVKYRAVDAKMFCQDSLPDKDLPSPPYNIDCINPLIVGAMASDTGNSPRITLIITEGEKDCLTLLACGYSHVISVPNGASCRPQTFMQPFVDWLRPVGTIVLCVDNDRAGRHLRQTLYDYFSTLAVGQRRGFSPALCTLSTACKDISEVHQRYGADEVRRVVDNATGSHPTCVLSVGDVSHGVREYLKGHYDQGFSLGYGEQTDRHLRLTDEGGLIVLTGRPGSGKTDWLRCTLTHLMVTGRACAFLSFEEPNKAKHVGRIIQVLLGTRNTQLLDDSRIDHVIGWLGQRMVNLDMGQVAPTTGNIYYMRHPSGRYFEQPSEQACKDMIRRHGTLVVNCQAMI
ncbi:MAG: toprim domain-containing protein [Bacteroidaceae bacterium]|nr:toprim domain-containing protein [Bacteroidaceae bacterium]